ncbi:MAG TPA: ABC transporter ATP-binding protein, partial [Burkholderiaceae bacterium]|nr:ABC transporter ATP-binding protein [Burkholderiaceae bacterium]
VGLDASVLNRYPHQFSGGQRQRICLARAIVMEPEILIADEATSALDVTVQGQVLELLADIKRRTQIAILFITHDLRVAAQISDKIIVMQHGKIVEQGTPQEIILNPTQAYTRELIQSAPGANWDFRNFRPLDAAVAGRLGTGPAAEPA